VQGASRWRFLSVIPFFPRSSPRDRLKTPREELALTFRVRLNCSFFGLTQPFLSTLAQHESCSSVFVRASSLCSLSTGDWLNSFQPLLAKQVSRVSAVSFLVSSPKIIACSLLLRPRSSAFSCSSSSAFICGCYALLSPVSFSPLTAQFGDASGPLCGGGGPSPLPRPAPPFFPYSRALSFSLGFHGAFFMPSKPCPHLMAFLIGPFPPL